MAEWRHKIPVAKHWYDLDDCSPAAEIELAAERINTDLLYHRAFLVYVDLPETQIEVYSDIAEQFLRRGYQGISDWEEFDEVLGDLYDWADRNRIWID